MNKEIFAYRRKCILNYEKLFRGFINKLIVEFGEKISIVLFGSRGRGDNKESSDYDLLIVLKEGEDKDRLQILKLKPLSVPMDIIVVNPSELSNPVLKKMLKQSKVLYDGLKCFS